MISTEDFEKIEITSSAALHNWLLQHHLQKESVWLVTYKKETPENYVSRWEVLDELLCFGWIDGIRRKLDAQRTMQLISPRKTQHWAKSYKDRVADLMDQNRMHPAGLKSIEVAKTSGLWNFMEDVDALIVPEDLKEALQTENDAASFFNGINDSSKRFVLRWLKLAKTEKTRQARIQKIVRFSKKGEKLPGS